MANTTLILVI